ncbi:MAG: DUF4229 domain-containing protein [Actinomycetota bacterium]|nr:DUF4229 domain-containing protein [Actinomycetota bacterium]
MFEQHPPGRATLNRDLVLYTLARLGLLAVIALLLVLAGVPVVVALLLALVVSLPLSVIVLPGLRARVNAGVAEMVQRRRAERDRLRAQLRGDQPRGDQPRGGQRDGGG